ncbi:MAG: hypothetical protein Q9182_006578 [Xanthomendoza sp. 2 TL-2023]
MPREDYTSHRLLMPRTPLQRPHLFEALEILDLEARILTTIGPHKHIIGYKGPREDGLLLERAQRGTLAPFLEEQSNKATEACVGVIQCDINVNNLLLDDDLAVKLCDFQELLLRPDGSVEKDGLARENIKSSMPRADPNYAGPITDIFALGSTFYYIMQGHETFPDMDPFDDEDQIQLKFTSCQFPELKISPDEPHKCEGEKYSSAEAVLQDLRSAIGHDVCGG